MKQQTRNKRTGKAPIEYIVKNNTNLKYTSIKDFLSHIKTKAQLTKYLSFYLLREYTEKSLLVTYDQITEGNVVVPEQLKSHSHEEADTLLILHAVLAPKDDVLVVECADTDVLILLIAHYKLIPTETFFETKKFNRLIRIHDAVAAIGEEKIESLIGAYILTGNDLAGKINGITKAFGFKQFLKANTEELEGLAKLVNSEASTENIFQSIESLICKMFRSPFKTLSETRWYMHSVKEAECEELPPSKASIIPHIQRAHYHALNYKNCVVPHPEKFNVEDYGYKIVDGTITPTMSTKPPAPDAVLNVVKCNCKV